MILDNILSGLQQLREKIEDELDSDNAEYAVKLMHLYYIEQTEELFLKYFGGSGK